MEVSARGLPREAPPPKRKNIKGYIIMRRYVIAGNWKMNKTPNGAKALIAEMKPLVAGKDN